MLEILDRHRIVSPGFDVPGRTGLAHLMKTDPDGSAAFGICSLEFAFASVRDNRAQRYLIIQNGSEARTR